MAPTPTFRASVALALVALALAARPAAAAKHAPFAARTGLATALSAASVWADDAALVVVENDEDVDGAGLAPRWGYLFASPSRGKARAYSVRDGRIVVAEDFDLQLAAPPVAGEWIDSEAALAAADEHAGRTWCRDHVGARATTVLLSRGPFQPGDPDETTWTVVYTADGQPSLFVVVDAREAHVRRTWKG